jgi:hypothetical protein
MTTTQEMTRPAVGEEHEGFRHRVGVMGGAASSAAGSAAAAAGDAMARMPAVASSAQSMLVEANRQIRTGSDEILIVGGALSFGFALGLLFGGANRLLVAGAMLPAATMGFTILERANDGWLERSRHGQS